MKRYSYATGALLGALLTALTIILITVRTGDMPRVISVWPLFAALGVSLVTWWLQGLIVAVLARPQLKILRIREMVHIYLASGFIWGISPIKGAEVPFQVYLLKRFGLSAGEGSTVVITRVLLDIAVLTPAALGGLVLTFNLPKVEHPPLLLAGSAVAGLIVVITLLMRKRGRWKQGSRKSSPIGSGLRVGGRAKISRFIGDIQRSITLFWRRGDRATLIHGGILTIVYWAFRLSLGPLALMAAGWSGDWLPVVVAQLLLFSLVLPLAPTPGGSGAREFGFAALLTGYVPEEQLLSGTIVYTGLAYCLPVIIGAFFAGRQLWQGTPVMTGGSHKAAESLGRGCECLDQRAVSVRSYNVMHHLVRMMRRPSGCGAERKRRVSESMTGGHSAKVKRGATAPVSSPFSASLGASVGFLLPNFPLGIFWFAALITLILLDILLAGVWMIAMAVTLAILWLIRKPNWYTLIHGLTLVFAPAITLCKRGAQVQRRRVARFVGCAVPSPYRQLPQGTLLARAATQVKDPAVWRDFAYLLLLLPVGAAEFAIVIGAFALPLVTIVLPMWLFIAFPEGIPLGQGVQIDTPLEALLIAIIALPVSALVGYLLVIGMSKAHVALDQALLWPSKCARLAQRVEELTESRSRAVEATIAERRRIERDLHDGAQQRLISLAMGLGMAKEKMATDPETAQELVEEAHGEVKRTLAEIRNLVRGIHPAVLSDRGLDAAVPALAVRCPVPVEVAVELDERLPEAAETTSYFVVAEALTNIAKHSGASEAQVFVRRERKPQNRLVIEVVDNGKGGAEPEGGAGLAGLADRLAALDGRLFIESPPGGPTWVQAELPLRNPKTTTRETL